MNNKTKSRNFTYLKLSTNFMQKFLPLFPLNLVAFPLEDLNLHIFEQRYRDLINECLDEGKTFGIPVFLDGRMPGFGTEVKITKLSKKYEDGRMDVHTQGIRVFRILDFQNPVDMKLYAGGVVELLPEFDYHMMWFRFMRVSQIGHTRNHAWIRICQFTLSGKEGLHGWQGTSGL